MSKITSRYETLKFDLKNIQDLSFIQNASESLHHKEFNQIIIGNFTKTNRGINCILNFRSTILDYYRKYQEFYSG